MLETVAWGCSTCAVHINTVPQLHCSAFLMCKGRSRGLAGYPEAYFARLALPAEAVMAVVAACRSDDIYHQVL